MHAMEMWVMMMRRTIRAYWVMIMMPIAVVPVQEWINAMIAMPPVWIVIPVVWRMPCYPTRSPEPIVYQWTIQIYGLDDIVRTIDILVAYHLDGHGFLLVLINEDRRHILIDILGQYGLDHH